MSLHFKLTATSPLLPQGLTITTEVPAEYVGRAIDELRSIAAQDRKASELAEIEEGIEVVVHRFEIDGRQYELVLEGDEIVELWELTDDGREPVDEEMLVADAQAAVDQYLGPRPGCTSLAEAEAIARRHLGMTPEEFRGSSDTLHELHDRQRQPFRVSEDLRGPDIPVAGCRCIESGLNPAGCTEACACRRKGFNV